MLPIPLFGLLLGLGGKEFEAGSRFVLEFGPLYALAIEAAARVVRTLPSPPSPSPALPPTAVGLRSLCQGIMARLVSTALVRGLVRSCRASSTAAVSRPAFQQFMTYSSGLSGDSNTNGDASTTRVAADPDTHQDFQPTSKSSDMSYDDKVAQDIKENPILIYMKGSTDAPRCGFSALAVKVLQLYGSPIIARDILSNHKLKETVKAHTNWPTFPQIFIKGEFVGGSDIILSMHQKGELKDLLADIAQK